MSHLLHLIIKPEQDGMSVRQFLRKELHFSMHQISRVKYRPEGILVNGQPKWVSETLLAGDDLCFSLDDPLPESVSSLEPKLPVLFEDDYLLAVNKPQGMVSHPSHGHHGDSALDLMQEKYRRLYLIGRLDKDTSGILLFAKHLETASLLSKQKESGTLSKSYLAAVHGIPDPAQGTIDAPIAVGREMPLKMKTDPRNGKPARTHYRTLKTARDCTGNAFSVLSVTIEHGRTHQIRVHLASAGHPLIGDSLYGNGTAVLPAALSDAADAEKKALSHACLHASALSFRHPYTGEPVRITAPPPYWETCDIF